MTTKLIIFIEIVVFGVAAYFLWEIAQEKQFKSMSKQMLPRVVLALVLAAGMMFFAFHVLNKAFNQTGAF